MKPTRTNTVNNKKVADQIPLTHKQHNRADLMAYKPLELGHKWFTVSYKVKIDILLSWLR